MHRLKIEGQAHMKHPGKIVSREVTTLPTALETRLIYEDGTTIVLRANSDNSMEVECNREIRQVAPGQLEVVPPVFS